MYIAHLSPTEHDVVQAVGTENAQLAREADQEITEHDSYLMNLVNPRIPMFEDGPANISTRLQNYQKRTRFMLGRIIDAYSRDVAPPLCQERLVRGELAGALGRELLTASLEVQVYGNRIQTN